MHPASLWSLGSARAALSELHHVAEDGGAFDLHTAGPTLTSCHWCSQQRMCGAHGWPCEVQLLMCTAAELRSSGHCA